MATTNAEIQTVVQQARAAAAANADFDGVKALAQIATVAAVQQDELAADVGSLSARVAADPTADVFVMSSTLAQVGGVARGRGMSRPRVWFARLEAARHAAAHACQQPRQLGPRQLGLAVNSPPARAPHCARPPPRHNPSPQSYSGEALQQKITAKAAELPDLEAAIKDQYGDLGRPPTPDTPVAAFVRNVAGIVAGTGGWRRLAGSAGGVVVELCADAARLWAQGCQVRRAARASNLPP